MRCPTVLASTLVRWGSHNQIISLFLRRCRQLRCSLHRQIPGFQLLLHYLSRILVVNANAHDIGINSLLWSTNRLQVFNYYLPSA